MNLEKFTDRAKGFLQAAQTVATGVVATPVGAVVHASNARGRAAEARKRRMDVPSRERFG